MTIAIACASGSFRGAFVHGVLSAFEGSQFQADAYAAASSSAFPAAYAAIGKLVELEGDAYWNAGLAYYQEHSHDASQMVMKGIEAYGPLLQDNLFREEVLPFLIATSAVVTDEAAQQTQGEGARRLGQRLLLKSRSNDRSWADEHLALHLFGTLDTEDILPLTPGNLADVFYASTRMLQSWKIPAAIDDRPYVDAAYTCNCPAIEMAELVFDEVIAIIPEPDTAYRDIFQSEAIPTSWNNSVIHFIQPEVSLGELEVDYVSATPAGLEAVFRLGEEKGNEFLTWFMARDQGS
ncbi:MAG: hypothetical protein ACE5M4_13245 [Anaerolineales bacterium]